MGPTQPTPGLWGPYPPENVAAGAWRPSWALTLALPSWLTRPSSQARSGTNDTLALCCGWLASWAALLDCQTAVDVVGILGQSCGHLAVVQGWSESVGYSFLSPSFLGEMGEPT